MEIWELKTPKGVLIPLVPGFQNQKPKGGLGNFKREGLNRWNFEWKKPFFP